MAKPTDQKLEHIKGVPLFARLNQRQLRQVARRADEVTVPPGRVLSREDRRGGHELLIVVVGELKVERGGKLLAELGPGDVVGEMSLIDRKPYSATVTATRETTLLVISGGWFASLLDDLPGLKDNILKVLVERLRAADDRLVG